MHEAIEQFQLHGLLPTDERMLQCALVTCELATLMRLALHAGRPGDEDLFVAFGAASTAVGPERGPAMQRLVELHARSRAGV